MRGNATGIQIQTIGVYFSIAAATHRLDEIQQYLPLTPRPTGEMANNPNAGDETTQSILYTFISSRVQAFFFCSFLRSIVAT